MNKESVCLITVTPDAEATMGYIARVSNPANQDNPNVEGLLSYCIKHGHWSVFEQAHMTLEINTTRAIAAQILRHRSFTYQEFSQRYADTDLLLDEYIPIPDLRRQDTKNRQNSIDDMGEYEKLQLQGKIAQHFEEARNLYRQLISHGVAKECARMVLPLATPTKIYMTGSVRSWIHYINLRSAHGTQKEHMMIAEACRRHFICQFPVTAKALDWCKECDCDQDYVDSLQPCLKIE